MKEITMERILFGKALEEEIPINGSIELLPLCNMNCDMCYIRLSPEEMKAQGRMRTKEEWLDLGRQMAEAGTMFLLLTGGEPLLYPDFKELYRELQNLGMILTVNTNGTLIDESWVDFFKKNPPRRINITLYGTNKEVYRDLCHYEDGFSKVMKAIVMLREAGIHVKINGSLVKENQGDYARILEIAKELDCAVNIDTHMQPAVRERSKPFDQQSRMDPEEAAIACMEIHHLQDSEEEYLARIHRIVNSVEEADQKTTEPIGITCLAARCSFTINWQGKMRPCVMMPGPEVDVFEKGFASGWESMNTECRNIYLNEKCFACQYRFICSTCVASAYHETGEYTGLPDYVCRYTKAMYEKAKDDSLMYQKKHNTK